MNNRAVTMSILMAIIAVFFVQSYVSSIEDKARRNFGDEVLVVTAKRDIREMATLDETMFTLKPVPKLYLEPSAISFDKKESSRMLFKAISQLPENQRIAFTLHKVDGLSYLEVSEVMNLTVSSIESLMHRAKNNLKKSLEKYYRSGQ